MVSLYFNKSGITNQNYYEKNFYLFIINVDFSIVYR